MKKTALMLSLSSALICGSAVADTLLGLYVGADMCQPSASGSFANDNQLQEFNFNDESQLSYYAALEHPVPLLPNLRLQHNPLESDGITTINADFTFAGETFNAQTELSNQIDLTSTDYVLYYEVLDNDLISLDLGINAKHLDGSVAVSESANANRIAVQQASQWIPMLYTSATIGLPLTGLEIFAEGSFVSYDGSRLFDAQGGFAYAMLDNLAVDLRLKLGYRAVNLRLDDIDDLYADLNFRGIYAGVELHF